MAQTLIWEEQGYKIIVKGELGNDYLGVCTKATSDPRFIDAKYAIVDFIEVEKFPIDADFVQKIALSDVDAYQRNPALKLAIIADKTVLTGLVSMYKTYFELNNNEKCWQIKMFTTEAEAREWINK